jgi:hypothetical protein
MASAVELRQWTETEKSGSRQQKLLLVLLVVMLAALLLSQPVAPLASVEPLSEPTVRELPVAPVAEKAVEPVLADQAFEPLAMELGESDAVAAEEASEPTAAGAVEERPSPEVPVGVASSYGNQSPYAGKPLSITGGGGGGQLIK